MRNLWNLGGNFLDFGNFLQLFGTPVSKFPALYEHTRIIRAHLNPVTPKISLVILFTLLSAKRLCFN